MSRNGAHAYLGDSDPWFYQMLSIDGLYVDGHISLAEHRVLAEMIDNMNREAVVR